MSAVKKAVANLRLAAGADNAARTTGDQVKMMESVLHYLEGIYWIDVALNDPGVKDEAREKLSARKASSLKRVELWRGQLGSEEVRPTFGRSRPSGAVCPAAHVQFCAHLGRRGVGVSAGRKTIGVSSARCAASCSAAGSAASQLISFTRATAASATCCIASWWGTSYVQRGWEPGNRVQ